MRLRPTLLVPERRVEAWIQGAPWFLLLGLAALVAGVRADGPGLLSAFLSLWLGASGLSLAAWRTERGLWRLAGLFGLVAVGVYGLFVWGAVRDAIQGRANGLWIALDAAVATLLLGGLTRRLLTAAVANWRHTAVHDASGAEGTAHEPPQR